ncbi:MAG: hypothetical protein D6814_14515 [Calditrichaeota bacterium]|nr:MAG: hypothetical protein D6814_14515 [Calditrichota bacterium]
MLFAGKIKLSRDSKEIRRAKKALEKEFAGQWDLNSDLPLRGILIIKEGKDGYQGIFKAIQPFALQDAIILKKLTWSARKGD